MMTSTCLRSGPGVRPGWFHCWRWRLWSPHVTGHRTAHRKSAPALLVIAGRLGVDREAAAALTARRRRLGHARAGGGWSEPGGGRWRRRARLHSVWCRIGSAVVGGAAAEGREGRWGGGGGWAEFRRAAAAAAGRGPADAGGAGGGGGPESPRSVSDLERGINRTARKDTAVLLADALGLAEPVRALFVAAARGRGPAAEVLAAGQGAAPGAFAAAATRTLPRDIVSFTGRGRELARLAGALTACAAGGGVVGIHAIDGMAGIGKTTFAVHAAHRLAGSFPDGQFFLPLHAHTPGQRPVDPADALASLLLTAGVAAQQIPPGLEARAARWRDHVAGKKILLLLDDAAGHEQVRPLLPGTAGQPGADHQPPPAGRAGGRRRDQPGHPAPEEAADPAGPAGRPARTCGPATPRPARSPGCAGTCRWRSGCSPASCATTPPGPAAGLAAELAAARDRLAAHARREPVGRRRVRPVLRGPDRRPAAAVPPPRPGPGPRHRRLRRRRPRRHQPGRRPPPPRRAVRPASDHRARTRPLPAARPAPRARPRPGRRRRPRRIRRRPPGRLLDYYLHTALAAGRHFTPWASAYRRPPPGRPPASAPELSTLGQAAAWLEAERANLHAAADYAAAHGRSLHAIAIPAAMSGFLAARGHWDQSAALHRTAPAAARQAWRPARRGRVPPSFRTADPYMIFTGKDGNK